jgi:hypothetical protein
VIYMFGRLSVSNASLAKSLQQLEHETFTNPIWRPCNSIAGPSTSN